MNKYKRVFSLLALLSVLICGSVGSSISSYGNSAADSTAGIVIGTQRRWANTNRVQNLDNQVSTSAGVSNGQFTTRLEVTRFDFGNLPDDAEISGVEVAITRSTTGNGARDHFIGLIIDGVVNLNSDICGRENCLGINHLWNPNALTKNIFGNATERWGINFDAGDIKKTNFGIALRGTSSQNNRDFLVDSVQLTVHFTSESYDLQQGGNGKKKNSPGTIAAAVIIPILFIGGAIASVAVYYHLKKTRPDLIEGWKQNLQKGSDPKRESNIDLEKATEEKPIPTKQQTPEPSYSSQGTQRIGDTTPKEQGSPAVPKRSIDLPNRPSRPASAFGDYAPSPTGSSYKPTPTTETRLSIDEITPRQSAIGGSVLNSSMLGNESPVVAKYHKSGKNAFSEKLVFGAPIDIVRTKNGIPVIVEDAISFLENKGYKEEGIVRLAGSSQDIKAIKEAYDKGNDPDFNRQGDIHSISGALKAYFRDLPQRPLIMTKGIRQASASTDENEIVDIMRKEFENIPEVNYLTLKRLFLFLNKVAAHSEQNRMPPDNLAIVFQPTLNLSKSLIIALINHPETFDK